MFERMAGPPGPYGVALALAAVGLASGCSSSQQSGSARALPAPTPPSSTTAAPHLTRPNSTTAGPRATEAAVVRQYFRIINHLDTDMNAAALARLMTPTCPCRIQVRAVQKEAALGRHYTGRDRINAIRPNLDGRRAGDVVVDFDTTSSGIASNDGRLMTSSAAATHLNRDFVMRAVHGRWLIARIDVL